MQYFRKIAHDLDVSDVNLQLAAHPELWDQFSMRRTAPGTPHSGMQDIWVRYNDVRPFIARGSMAGFNEEHVPIWYPSWYKVPALRPLVLGLADLVHAEMIGGVLITKIPPGHRIDPHADKGWHVSYFADKFYISLQAAPGAQFHTTDEFIEPAVGDCWRFDNRREHWVSNDSDRDRVTLIVCLRTDLFEPHPSSWE